MSTNIGSMMRALMGEMQPEGTRALELRVGQIVRGVLMEMLNNHEALMNINGVQVRAKLETELPVGKGTLLQVQPGSAGGMISLKPLAESSDVPADESLKASLKSFGLPVHKGSLELIRGLTRDGYPIGKETAAFFQAAVSLKPAGVDLQSWLGAADVAFRRGLPPSQETIASLRQALFGPPVHEEMARLSDALKQCSAQSADGQGAKFPFIAGLAGRLQTLLAQGDALLAQGTAEWLGTFEEDRAPEQPSACARLSGRQATLQPGRAEEAKGPANPAPATGDGAVSTVTPSVNANAPAARAATAAGKTPLPAAVSSAEASVKVGVASDSANAIGVERPAGQSAPVTGRDSGAAASSAAPRAESAWIGRFLQWMGAGHENRLLQTAAALRSAADNGTLAPSAAGEDGMDRPVPDAARNAADSLKSALLSLAAHEDAPPALRDAAQSLVSQITGQQLLLASERQPNTPFSHMTLFVPMKGPNGDSTATIHVQTRRSRRGEWDTDNCRLLFDLRMRHLGDMVVDVQVVDRIVSLKLMNDHPGMTDMVDHARAEINAGLRAAGFQLLSMTAVPLPTRQESSSGETGDYPELAHSAYYAAKPYKGVDFRA